MIYHVFANKRNIGDWVSARRIQSLMAPLPVHEVFCDAAFAKASLRTLARADERDLIVIGGGGLIQDYFLPFWAGFEAIAERVPFCAWGVGACGPADAGGPLMPLVRRILARAQLTVVRDEMTRAMIGPDRLSPPVPCPGLTLAVAGSPIKGGGLVHAVHPDLLGSDAVEGIAAAIRTFAAISGRAYRETSHIIANGSEAELSTTLEMYARAELVVSSRLHGCIIGLASGCRVLALSSDPKVDQFMHAAGLGEWICDPRDLATLSGRLRELASQPAPYDFLQRAACSNQSVAQEIRTMIETHGIQTQLDSARVRETVPGWDAVWRQRVAEQIADVVPPGMPFLLVDESVFADGGPKPPAGAVPFPATGGEYWGPPASDADAIEELDRRRRDDAAAAAFLVFVAPAFWWLDHYQDFARDLRSRFRMVVETHDLMVFDLRTEIAAAGASLRPVERSEATPASQVAVAIPAGGTADYERWSSLANFHEDWDGRTQLLARLVPPGARVIEFGAGRRQLERHLDPSCAYFPSDLLDRGPGTIVCDLNARPLPDLQWLRPDVGVFSGVLEYLTGLREIARWLAGQVSTCVISYACAKTPEAGPGRARERAARARNGWVNAYTDRELLDVFESGGFDCRIRRSWKDQQIFVLDGPARQVSVTSADEPHAG